MELRTDNKKVAVFGGGRWARVWLKILIENTEPSVSFTVYTKYLYGAMNLWVKNESLESRVKVSDKDPNFNEASYFAAIVVNAAQDHKESTIIALNAQVPVLVEKPLTTTFSDTSELIETAKINDTQLFTSWVFRYTSYLDNFIRCIGDIGNVKEVKILWADKISETRYGEVKNFDAATPIFMDVLPHAMSILSKILNSEDYELVDCKVKNGGSHLDILIRVSQVPCHVILERNSVERKREIIVTGEKRTSLDFSEEPGSIISDDVASSGDKTWDVSPSPLTKMAIDFLKEARSGISNHKLSSYSALAVSSLVDEVKPIYRNNLYIWLKEAIFQNCLDRLSLEYFITEFVKVTLRKNRSESNDFIEEYIKAFNDQKVRDKIQNMEEENFVSKMDRFMMSLGTS